MKQYIKVKGPIQVEQFHPDMAVRALKGEEGKEFYFIRTCEGYRMADESMFVAHKANGYSHPMSPDILQKHFREYPGYDCAMAVQQEIEKVKRQLLLSMDHALVVNMFSALDKYAQDTVNTYGERDA